MRFFSLSTLVLFSTLLASCGQQHSNDQSSEIKVANGGKPDERIRKHIVYIELKGEKFNAGCTGTLVTTHHVLTAAHCISVLDEKSTVNVVFMDDVRKGIDKKRTIPVVKARMFPGFNPAFSNDINATMQGMKKFAQDLALNSIASDFMLDPISRYNGKAGALALYKKQLSVSAEAYAKIKVNDVGLLTMAEPAPDGFEQAPILSPTSKVAGGAALKFAGYGVSNMAVAIENMKMEAEHEKKVKASKDGTKISLKLKDDGAGLLRGAKFKFTEPAPNNLFFALPEKNEKNEVASVGPGDSGGGIFVEMPKQNAHAVIGIASMATMRETGSAGGWFIDVRPYAKQIVEWVQEDDL